MLQSRPPLNGTSNPMLRSRPARSLRPPTDSRTPRLGAPRGRGGRRVGHQNTRVRSLCHCPAGSAKPPTPSQKPWSRAVRRVEMKDEDKKEIAGILFGNHVRLSMVFLGIAIAATVMGVLTPGRLWMVWATITSCRRVYERHNFRSEAGTHSLSRHSLGCSRIWLGLGGYVQRVGFSFPESYGNLGSILVRWNPGLVLHGT